MHSIAGQGSSKRASGKHKHYKRVHHESSGSSRPNNTYYAAAAEDDHHGWTLDQIHFDPMYTVDRRDREQNAEGKDSFFKRLKAQPEKLEAAPSSGQVPEPQKEKAPGATAPVAPVQFGFGMMGAVPAQDPKKPRKDKGKKSKK